jgi:hypothetical protein
MDVDLRACHLSFLADYLYRIKPSEKLLNERGVWRAVFTSKETDPRKFFATQGNIDMDKDPLAEKKIKKLMNSWINGGKFPVFDKYMKEYWGPIYKVWKKLNKKTIGNGISKTLESEIFRADWVVKLQKKHKVVALSTHDGFCLYGEKTDADSYLKEFFEESKRIAGWELYFKVDKKIEFDTKTEIDIFDLKIQEAVDKENVARVEFLTKEKTDYIQRIS